MLDIHYFFVIITFALNAVSAKRYKRYLKCGNCIGVICESAGTGRQARLRGVCQPTWEFKSPLSHHNRTLIRIRLGSYCFAPHLCKEYLVAWTVLDFSHISNEIVCEVEYQCARFVFKQYTVFRLDFNPFRAEFTGPEA